jgi:hypothetical protein
MWGCSTHSLRRARFRDVAVKRSLAGPCAGMYAVCYDATRSRLPLPSRGYLSRRARRGVARSTRCMGELCPGDGLRFLLHWGCAGLFDQAPSLYPQCARVCCSRTPRCRLSHRSCQRAPVVELASERSLLWIRPTARAAPRGCVGASRSSAPAAAGRYCLPLRSCARARPPISVMCSRGLNVDGAPRWSRAATLPRSHGRWQATGAAGGGNSGPMQTVRPVAVSLSNRFARIARRGNVRAGAGPHRRRRRSVVRGFLAVIRCPAGFYGRIIGPYTSSGWDVCFDAGRDRELDRR